MLISQLDGVQETPFEMDSFLMVGQSNMAGRGDLSDLTPFPAHDCWMLRMGRWQPMQEPVNVDRTFLGEDGAVRCGVGLASSFAFEHYKATNRRTGLIPCADGGTKIQQWMPTEPLFEHAVYQARLAMRSSTLKAILWHQGESDCGKTVTDGYLEHLCTVLSTLRQQLGDVPIVLGEISEECDCPKYETSLPVVQEMNRMIHMAASLLPRCAIASAKGLSLKPDGIHFCTSAQQAFGKRYYEQYRTVSHI